MSLRTFATNVTRRFSRWNAGAITHADYAATVVTMAGLRTQVRSPPS